MRLKYKSLCLRDVLVLNWLKRHGIVTIKDLEQTFPEYQATGLSLSLRLLRAHGFNIKKKHMKRHEYAYYLGVDKKAQKG